MGQHFPLPLQRDDELNPVFLESCSLGELQDFATARNLTVPDEVSKDTLKSLLLAWERGHWHGQRSLSNHSLETVAGRRYSEKEREQLAAIQSQLQTLNDAALELKGSGVTRSPRSSPTSASDGLSPTLRSQLQNLFQVAESASPCQKEGKFSEFSKVPSLSQVPDLVPTLAHLNLLTSSLGLDRSSDRACSSSSSKERRPPRKSLTKVHRSSVKGNATAEEESPRTILQNIRNLEGHMGVDIGGTLAKLVNSLRK